MTATSEADRAAVPVPSSRLTHELATDFAALAPLRDEWDDCVIRTGSEVYLTYDWCRTWWQHYGARARLCVLLFRHDGRLVGVLPMMIDRLWLGPIPLRLAKIVGAEFTPVVLSPPVQADCAEAVYTLAFRILLEQCRCDAILFRPLAGSRPHREQIRRACQAGGDRVRLVHDRDYALHAALPLPDSYEKYLASLSGDHRGQIRRLRRRLEEKFPVTLEVIDEPARVEAAFDEFLQLHQARWQADNRLGHFGDFPRSLAFNRDLVRTLAPLGRVWIARLRVDGKTVACEYSFVLDRTLYWRLPGRAVGEPWESLGIGRLSLVYLFEGAMQRQVRLVEAGSGDYRYKRQLGMTDHAAASMVIAANRPWAALKSGPLLRLFGRLLDFLYLRLWVYHIAPRLPLPRRPLSMLWMRSRV